MEEIKTNGEVSFEEALEETLKTLNTGDVVEGVVVDVTPTEVIVDLGSKSDGIIPASELTDDPDAKPADVVKVGETIEVLIEGKDALKNMYIGRSKACAPDEVDGVIYVNSNKDIPMGSFVNVTITDALAYDLIGTAV